MRRFRSGPGVETGTGPLSLQNCDGAHRLHTARASPKGTRLHSRSPPHPSGAHDVYPCRSGCRSPAGRRCVGFPGPRRQKCVAAIRYSRESGAECAPGHNPATRRGRRASVAHRRQSAREHARCRSAFAGVQSSDSTGAQPGLRICARARFPTGKASVPPVQAPPARRRRCSAPSCRPRRLRPAACRRCVRECRNRRRHRKRPARAGGQWR